MHCLSQISLQVLFQVKETIDVESPRKPQGCVCVCVCAAAWVSVIWKNTPSSSGFKVKWTPLTKKRNNKKNPLLVSMATQRLEPLQAQSPLTLPGPGPSGS